MRFLFLYSVSDYGATTISLGVYLELILYIEIDDLLPVQKKNICRKGNKCIEHEMIGVSYICKS